jgi:uncharacterized membrane protein
MSEIDSLELPMLRIGRLLFALSVVASGIYQLVTGRFVNLVPVDPAHVQPWQAYLLGVLLVLIGVGLLVRRTTSAAAVTLAVLLLVLFFGFSLRAALPQASMGYVWVDPLMILALLGGVSLAAVRHDGSPLDRVFETATRFAPLALGAFLAYCGALHFPYAKYVAGLIPPWIPAHLFWTYVAGVALIAGGIGVVVPRTARLAATLAGIMLFSWVFLVHIPLAIRTQSVGETARIFEALGDSAVAFMVAGVSRGPRS